MVEIKIAKQTHAEAPLKTLFHLHSRSYSAWAHKIELPDFQILTDPADLMRADCVLVHLPSMIVTNDIEQLYQLRRIVPTGQIWVAELMESAAIYTQMNDPAFMALFDLEMSYRQSADIWIPYIPADFDEKIEQYDPSPRRHLCCAFVSSTFDQSKRRDYIKALSEKLNVHSYGRFMRNRRLWWDRGLQTKLNILRKYGYTLAFENSITPDYITEKFYHPLMMGSVPVYLGAPNIQDFAPAANSYIDVRNFTGPAELADFIVRTDPSHFHSWRNKPLSPAFTEKLERVKLQWQSQFSNAITMRLRQLRGRSA